MKKLVLFFLTSFLLFSCVEKKDTLKNSHSFSAEEKIDSTHIKHFFNAALTKGKSYEWLRDLTGNIGGRLSGSPEAALAVKWGERVMKEAGLDTVWLQPALVPHWVRGEKEISYFVSNGKKIIFRPSYFFTSKHFFENLIGSPNGIRTRVTALRGRRPRPLDDGAIQVKNTYF